MKENARANPDKMTNSDVRDVLLALKRYLNSDEYISGVVRMCRDCDEYGQKALPVAVTIKKPMVLHGRRGDWEINTENCEYWLLRALRGSRARLKLMNKYGIKLSNSVWAEYRWEKIIV